MTDLKYAKHEAYAIQFQHEFRNHLVPTKCNYSYLGLPVTLSLYIADVCLPGMNSQMFLHTCTIGLLFSITYTTVVLTELFLETNHEEDNNIEFVGIAITVILVQLVWDCLDAIQTGSIRL